jgi:hypothetical protein
MSIEAAAQGLAKELTKEIERLTKETERLTKLRDSVLAGSVSVNSQTTTAFAKNTAAKKASAKAVVAKKTVTEKAAAPKKRTLSAAGRKAIIDATKRRWAEKKKADAAK